MTWAAAQNMILGDVQTYLFRQQVAHMILRPLSFSHLFLLDLFVACVLTYLTEAICIYFDQS